jgi:hypothetical protein
VPLPGVQGQAAEDGEPGGDGRRQQHL